MRVFASACASLPFAFFLAFAASGACGRGGTLTWEAVPFARTNAHVEILQLRRQLSCAHDHTIVDDVDSADDDTPPRTY